MTYNKHNLPAVCKPCPKCGGTGQVLCDGKEYYRQLHEEWAKSYHMKPVVYNWLSETVVPGLAVAQLLSGGWWGLKIYVAVGDIPKTGIYEAGSSGYQTHRIDGRGIPQPVTEIKGVDLWNFDVINDKAFWRLTCRYSNKSQLSLLDHWPEGVSLQDAKMLESGTE